MGKKNKKKDKNPSKESKTAQQTSGNIQPQAAHASGQSKHQKQSSQQQSTLPAAKSSLPVAPNLSSLQIDERKSSPGPSTWSQVARPQGNRSEEKSDSLGAKPKAQAQRPQHPRGDRNPDQSGMSLAVSTKSVQSEKSTGSASGAKQPAKRPAPITMEDLKNKGIEPLNLKSLGYGTKGKPLGLIETNYLELMWNKMVPNAYHYDVTIDPNRPKKMLAKVFLEFVKINFPRASIAFDGIQNAYASAPLQIGELQSEIKIDHPDTGKQRTFNVEIQAVDHSQIPIKSLLQSYKKNTIANEDPALKRGLQAMEVILKSAFYQEHLRSGVVGGRSFFLPPQQRINLGDFTELWLGLFQSTVLGDVPFLNVDVNHKAFFKWYNSLAVLLKDIGIDMERDPNQVLSEEYINDLGRHLSGLDICYDNKIVKKFVDIIDPPGQATFSLKNGEQTVLQYFNNINKPIKYLNLPCIELGSMINPDLKKKNLKVPMEYCTIPNTQVINKKCTENQTRKIIEQAATPTDVRKDKIMELLRQIQHNEAPVIKGFGLNIDEQFAKVPARQLYAPAIQYGKDAPPQKPFRGVWKNEKMEFLLPKAATEWGILNTNFPTKPEQLNGLARMLLSVSRNTGLQLAGEPYIRTITDHNNIKAEIDRIGKEKRIKILFVVIPDNGPMYSSIKKMAELDYGVLTQCIKGGTVRGYQNEFKFTTTISNILLKVNAKLNGTNHKLSNSTINILTKEKCMFIGADVTHPSPDQKDIPSIVGVATSFDDNAFCYNASKMYLQGPRIEIIQDFEEIITERLNFYKKKNNGVLPSKIFYYRDGVSEGQFAQVMAIERNAMLKACQNVQQGYEKRVKMTVVIVQKRHHTRFFPGATGVGKDDRKNNNVPAGTIVDKVITRPGENHFYLVSHQSIQGVAKPTKYCILLDQGNHTMDDLQGLTYDLCHLFTRCNRAVSYPAPTYYAHLAAARGREYIRDKHLDMDNLRGETEKITIKDGISKDHPMFFV